MYKSTRTPVMECEYPTRPDGKAAVPCGRKHADLVLVKDSIAGKAKKTWAWWCDDHRDFYERYLSVAHK